MSAFITVDSVAMFTDAYLHLVYELASTGTHRDDPLIKVIVEAEMENRVRADLTNLAPQPVDVQDAAPLPVATAAKTPNVRKPKPAAPSQPAPAKKTRQGAATPSRDKAPKSTAKNSKK